MHVGFGCADSNGTGFEAVHSDVSELLATCMHYLGNYSSWGYFWNIFQHYTKTTPEENSHKMFHISSPIVLFIWEGQGHFWGDKDQISSGDGKKKG